MALLRERIGRDEPWTFDDIWQAGLEHSEQCCCGKPGRPTCIRNKENRR